MIIRPVARALNSRPIDKTVVPTDYFKTSLTNLVFCYRSGDLVLLHLDFTGLSVVRPRSAIEDNESSICAKCSKRMVQYG